MQITVDRLIINTEAELLNFINTYNSKLTLYYSLYGASLKLNSNTCCYQQQGDFHFCNSAIDKICFDIDNLNAISIIKKFHLYLLKNNLKHLMLFSGQKGFHVYIFTKNNANLKNPKVALLNSHNYLIHQIKLNKDDVDNHILGDISRLMRIPNTMHLGSKLYCIPVTTEDLIAGKSYILNKAKQQNFNFAFYGTELFDISTQDSQRIEHQIINSYPEIKVEVSIDKQKMLDELPECIQNLLLMPYLNYRQRFYVIRYLQHKGHSDVEIDLIMKSFLRQKLHPSKGHDNYLHYLKERQLLYVKNNHSLFSCSALRREGYCRNLVMCEKLKSEPLYL